MHSLCATIDLDQTVDDLFRRSRRREIEDPLEEARMQNSYGKYPPATGSAIRDRRL